MLNSKLIDILRTLSAEELKKFGEFLNSPFHNKNRKAILLYEIISAFHPTYSSPSLTKEMLFSKIFSQDNSKFNDALIRNLLSDLMILCEDFLGFMRFGKDRLQLNESTLRELADRKLPSVFEKKMKQSEKILSSREFEGEEEYFRRYVLEDLKSSVMQFADNLSLYKDDSVLRSSSYLTYFFLIKIFKTFNFFRFQKQYNIEHRHDIASFIAESADLDKALSLILPASGNRDEFRIMKVYAEMYRAMSNIDEDSYYFEFRKALYENEKLFAPLEKYGLFVCLNNICILKIDAGNEAFYKECFDVYMKMLERNLFSAYAGYFPLSAFAGIVNTGLASGEINKVKKFIAEYSSLLRPEVTDTAMNFSMAQLSFHEGEYAKALEHIGRTDMEFPNFKYQLRLLQLKIFYETGDLESMDYAIDSFRHFLSKNKIVGKSYRDEFGVFLRALEILAKCRYEAGKGNLHDAKQLIENNASAGKGWLRKKISELERSKKR